MDTSTTLDDCISLEDCQRAAEGLQGAIARTPLVEAPLGISAQGSGALRLKLENLQLTGSFKPRGACNRLTQLSAEQRARGVIAMSAGNHAQGVAYHANRLGIPATIVMPATTPFSKVERTRQHGASVELYGRGLADCKERVETLIEEQGLVLVHPYDDPAIIAGQSTVGLEILADWPEVETIVVPIGGGGLISGIAIAAKAIKPDVRIIGVQAEFYPSMRQAISGETPTSGGETLAEGIAVKTPGELTKAIIRDLVDEILLVSETEIETAVCGLAEHGKIIAEGAGAATLAALAQRPSLIDKTNVAAVVSGGNIDARMLGSVLMRGLGRDGRLVRVRIEIHDEPGVLSRLTGLIGAAGGNIVEVYHQRLFQNVPVKHAEVDVVIETRNAGHVEEILERLRGEGFSTRLQNDLS